MKVLILCNKSPYPAKEGGPIAINMIVEGLIDAGHQVKVLAMNTNKYTIDPASIPEAYRIKTGIELIYVDLKVRIYAAFLNLFTGGSYHVERFISSDYSKRLTEILKSEHFDVVQFEMPYMSPYLALVKKHSTAKVFLRAHNIEHKIWERIAQTTQSPLKRWYLRHLAKTLKHHEMSVLNDFDGVAAISEVDAEFFRTSLAASGTKVDPSAIITIPFGIDVAKFSYAPPPDTPPTLFSIGAMNWIPNAEGVKWFLEHVWPEVTAQFPLLTFHIAGREMPDWLTNSHYPNVIVEGEVEDAQLFMEAHSVMIVPLFSGSGIRIKIIEGMAKGKAIISTPVGAEGIDYTPGVNILIAGNPTEFIQKIQMCMNDPCKVQELGQQARILIEKSYDRSTIIQNLLRFYQKAGS
jgi:glycosyltransferase involved in cell wall biosynthesis